MLSLLFVGSVVAVVAVVVVAVVAVVLLRHGPHARTTAAMALSSRGMSAPIGV
jgi:hypothetical protein